VEKKMKNNKRQFLSLFLGCFIMLAGIGPAYSCNSDYGMNVDCDADTVASGTEEAADDTASGTTEVATDTYDFCTDSEAGADDCEQAGDDAAEAAD
jgi:hypothetical protein